MTGRLSWVRPSPSPTDGHVHPSGLSEECGLCHAASPTHRPTAKLAPRVGRGAAQGHVMSECRRQGQILNTGAQCLSAGDSLERVGPQGQPGLFLPQPETRGLRGEGAAWGRAGPTCSAAGLGPCCKVSSSPSRSLSSLKWAGFGGFPGPHFFVIQGANLGIELAPSRGSQKG